jgi:hypothetical protein
MSVWVGIGVLLLVIAAVIMAFVVARPKEVKQWCTASNEDVQKLKSRS